MKKLMFFLTLILTSFSFLGQNYEPDLINNKGNRLQTYPRIIEINQEISDMMNLVSTESIESFIQWMQDLDCRGANHEVAVITQNWIVDHFESLGLETYIDLVPCGGWFNTFWNCDDQATLCIDNFLSQNVIAIQTGTKYPDEIIIVCGHYDHPDGPGADDNASGTSAVLELSRVLSQYEFDRTIMYIALGVEEFGLLGSQTLAKKFAEDNLNILAVLNHDMISFFPEFINEIEMYIGYSDLSNKLGEFYLEIADIYTPEIQCNRLSTDNSDASDHIPFMMFEFPALFIGDTEYIDFHDCYHKACDTLGHGANNLDLATAFVKSSLAVIAELANGYLPPQNFSAIPSEDNIFLSWDDVENTSVYKVYRDNILITETQDNYYIDENAIEEIEYDYHVISIREDDGFASNESNHDYAKVSQPLVLPYNNSFESLEALDNFKFYGGAWTLTGQYAQEGSLSLTNSNTAIYFDNYLTIAELPWFSIHKDTEDISLKLYYRGNPLTSWGNYIYMSGFYVEITKDRKKWDKVLRVSKQENVWGLLKVSLNEYIGEDFVQIRFRFESFGSNEFTYGSKQMYIDNFSIETTYTPPHSVSEYQNISLKNFKIYPNPSNGIFNIETKLHKPYNLSVFNINGTKIANYDNFTDGELNLNHLKPEMYYIVITTGNDRIAKKIVII